MSDETAVHAAAAQAREAKHDVLLTANVLKDRLRPKRLAAQAGATAKSKAGALAVGGVWALRRRPGLALALTGALAGAWLTKRLLARRCDKGS
ncbi:hypothetical protein [Stakelama saccharophila]|uniref:DUF3618 domain-containing protein n=1 Tax=Stakelama saccharophila TaxID=3075605 RepID=A0ABZ0BC77_9SPHN|nr:hypothetical protein [Stakelama sp. W311]WNO55041.1 hypothetical protein RPR59_07300 [Stakelama sp. W311]